MKQVPYLPDPHQAEGMIDRYPWYAELSLHFNSEFFASPEYDVQIRAAGVFQTIIIADARYTNDFNIRRQ